MAMRCRARADGMTSTVAQATARTSESQGFGRQATPGIAQRVSLANRGDLARGNWGAALAKLHAALPAHARAKKSNPNKLHSKINQLRHASYCIITVVLYAARSDRSRSDLLFDHTNESLQIAPELPLSKL